MLNELRKIQTDFALTDEDLNRCIKISVFLKILYEYSEAPYNISNSLMRKQSEKFYDSSNIEYLLGLSRYNLGRKSLLNLRAAKDGCPITGEEVLRLVLQVIGRHNFLSSSHEDFYAHIFCKTFIDNHRAARFYTPKAVTDTIVSCIAPGPDEKIADPCCGSGGFLLSAKSYMESKTEELHQCRFEFYGWEIVENSYRTSLMNLCIHGFQDEFPIIKENFLTFEGEAEFDCIMSNPPFGNLSCPNMGSHNLPLDTRKLHLLFLRQIKLLLKPGGRAAVILPDSFLYGSGRNYDERRLLFEQMNLHTIIRLPVGIYRGTNVCTSIVFFNNEPADEKYLLYIYDLRYGKNCTYKKDPLTYEDMSEIRDLYNNRNKVSRRWKGFSRDEILANEYMLDFDWLNEEERTEYPKPEILLDKIQNDMKVLSDKVQKITKEQKEL